MAARLSVIMVHSAPATAHAQRKAEEVVGELIGRPGIDLTLVGPLLGLTKNSTDRLTLESLSGDVAILDWGPPEQTMAALQSIEFSGRLAPHRDAPTATPPTNQSGRRIYALDLNAVPDAAHVIKSLEILKESRQVRTFSLGAATRGPVDSQPEQATEPAPHPPTGLDPPSSAPANHPHPEEPGRQPASPPPVATRLDPQTLDLDDLLDQLDQLDP